MRGIITFILLFGTLYGQENKYEHDAINWVRELIKQDSNMNRSNLLNPNIPLSKCHTNVTNSIDEMFKIYVFLSFSVPKETWIELSADLKKVNGVIVLRGIPNNSFVELSKRIQDLDKEGLSIPIQIDPLLFEKFAITKVPSYIVVEGDKFDKVSGNVSIRYALDLIASKGETEEAKRLNSIRGNERW